MPTNPNSRLHFFHSHNCLPRRPVSMLANKTLDNVTLASWWTVVDCDWLPKCKHLFRLYSHLPPDVLSCSGTALRLWGVGSVERGMALWVFFFTARNMGEGRYFFFFFCQLKINKTLLNGRYSVCSHTKPSPTENIHQKIHPLQAVLMFYLVQACVLKL